jgi:hypothetical protein
MQLILGCFYRVQEYVRLLNGCSTLATPRFSFTVSTACTFIAEVEENSKCYYKGTSVLRPVSMVACNLFSPAGPRIS